jgi:hypothetical protein
MNFGNKTNKFNYPYEEAKEQWKKVSSKDDLIKWHKKYTSWFHDEIILRLATLEWNEIEKKKNGNLNIIEESLNKLLLEEKKEMEKEENI